MYITSKNPPYHYLSVKSIIKIFTLHLLKCLLKTTILTRSIVFKKKKWLCFMSVKMMGCWANRNYFVIRFRSLVLSENIYDQVGQRRFSCMQYSLVSSQKVRAIDKYFTSFQNTFSNCNLECLFFNHGPERFYKENIAWYIHPEIKQLRLHKTQ